MPDSTNPPVSTTTGTTTTSPAPAPTAEQTQASVYDALTTKISSIARSMSVAASSIMCPVGSDCYIKQQTTLLNNNFAKAKLDYQNGPLEISLAEKNIYEYNAGQPGGDTNYNIAIIDRFATTAKEMQQNSIDKQQEYMADLAQALRQYQSQVPLLKRTEQLLETRQKEHDELVRKIDLYKKILQTNERKVVYEIKDTSGIYTYRRVMMFLYYGAIVCYIIFSNFIPDKLYQSYIVWLIIVIVSIIPIILNMVIRWIFIIGDVTAYWFKNDMPHRDIYTKLKDNDYLNH
jgi:hypothetical protein